VLLLHQPDGLQKRGIRLGALADHDPVVRNCVPSFDLHPGTSILDLVGHQREGQRFEGEQVERQGTRRHGQLHAGGHLGRGQLGPGQRQGRQPNHQRQVEDQGGGHLVQHHLRDCVHAGRIAVGPHCHRDCQVSG